MKPKQKTVTLDDLEEGAVIQGLMMLRNELVNIRMKAVSTLIEYNWFLNMLRSSSGSAALRCRKKNAANATADIPKPDSIVTLVNPAA